MVFEGRFTASSQDDIPPISESPFGLGCFEVEVGDQTFTGGLIAYPVQNRVVRDKRISRKIHLRDEPRNKGGAEKGKVNMRRAPRVVVIPPRVGTGFDRRKRISPLVVG